MADRVECVVIGAGVVGLAVARALALAGREVLLLEAESHHGTATSARLLRTDFTTAAAISSGSTSGSRP